MDGKAEACLFPSYLDLPAPSGEPAPISCANGNSRLASRCGVRWDPVESTGVNHPRGLGSSVGAASLWEHCLRSLLFSEWPPSLKEAVSPPSGGRVREVGRAAPLSLGHR